MYAYPDTPFTIMCFTWNAGGLRLCETTVQEQADEDRKGFLAFITRKKECIVPDFFDDISTIITKNLPSVLVMTTQDEDDKNTYFHSDLLDSTMPKLGYTLLKRNKLSGVGNSYDVRVPTGKPSGVALRTSIYAHNSVYRHLSVEEKIITKFLGEKEVTTKCGKTSLGTSSGAIASYVWHERYGKFAFISVHLPSQKDDFETSLDYVSFRAATKSRNSLCLLNIYNQFVTSLEEKIRPDHVFLLGDLNYDIVIPNKGISEVQRIVTSDVTIKRIKELQTYDELKNAMKEVPLIGFKEGVSSEGPLFIPTWKLARFRDDSCDPIANTTKINRSCLASPGEQFIGVGWHDRILYKEMMTSNYLAHCSNYSRIDIGNMHASTNAGVFGFFEMRSI